MKVGSEIGKKFLLEKISSYTVYRTPLKCRLDTEHAQRIMAPEETQIRVSH